MTIFLVALAIIAVYAIGEHFGWEQHKSYIEERDRKEREWQRSRPNYISNYELYDWDEPACVVFSRAPHEPMRWKVMRYGRVLNGFFTKKEAEAWLKEKLEVKS